MAHRMEPNTESAPAAQTTAAECCGSEEKAVCCAPEAKSGCCGDESQAAAAGKPRPQQKTCGCR